MPLLVENALKTLWSAYDEVRYKTENAKRNQLRYRKMIMQSTEKLIPFESQIFHPLFTYVTRFEAFDDVTDRK
jgi:hypothetical protein